MRRFLWVPGLLLVVVLAAIVVRFTYLRSQVRAQLGDELEGPLEVAQVEVDAWREAHRGRAAAAPISDSTFKHFRTRRRLRESRTSLLARRGDSVIVLASAGDGSPVQRAFAWATVPSHVRDAFGRASSRGTADRGLFTERVVYATVGYPAERWVLLRELQGGEIAENLLGPIALDVLFVSALILVVFAYLRARTRAANLQRDQELAAMRADFVASVSHELRTPLAQIRLFAQLLRTKSLRTPDEVDRGWNVIEKESGRLAILVDNVLNHAASSRSNGTRPSTQGTDVARDVEYVIDAFAPLAAEKGIAVISEIDRSVPVAIESDALRQILLNLLENAAKYGPRGQTVTIASADENDAIRILVTDEGPGVSLAERDAIWNPFARGEAARTSRAPGAGIGLSVVRDLVTRYGGRAWVDSSQARGASFVIELPKAR